MHIKRATGNNIHYIKLYWFICFLEIRDRKFMEHRTGSWLHKTHKHTMPTLLLVYWSLYEFSEVTGLINIFGCFEIVCLILNATTCFQQLQLQ
jgi:uncharacterized membrane protein